MSSPWHACCDSRLDSIQVGQCALNATQPQQYITPTRMASKHNITSWLCIFSFFPQLTQSVSTYRTHTPSFLVALINHLILFDKHRIFHFDSLNLPIDAIPMATPETTPAALVRFLGLNGEGNLTEPTPETLETPPKPQDQIPPQRTPLTPEEYTSVEFAPNEYLVSRVAHDILKRVSETTCTSLNQFKLRALANCYVNYADFLEDFQSLVTWNQLYRAKSDLSFAWISTLIELFQKLAGDTFKDKLRSKKADDTLRLMKYQTFYKVQTNTYPFVPVNFREYTLINQYLPTPIERSDIISDKMRSQKVAVECPSDCACLSDRKEPYCTFSLIQGTWESGCKNRENKIECSHSDPDTMKRCRNAEIKSGEKKSCKTSPGQEGEFDIEECLIWGIDFFTRKNIIHSLPESAVVDMALRDNQTEKSDFVNNLLKAANFNGAEGWNMRKACQFIIDNSPQQSQKTDLLWKLPQSVDYPPTCMFKIIDKVFAQHLLKVLDLNIDQTGFRIHTKGKGARCLNPHGIKQSSFIVEYFGQVYETWRWYERQDHTKRIMKEQRLSNLPDFYNIYLQKHNDQPEGYEMLVVDPISHGNFASRFSHSCHPNCGTITTVSDGKYYIGMYALRDIEIGEELTFDYCSITESAQEHNQAICLCGAKICRGNYLQLGNAKQQNYVLEENLCFLSRNSTLLHSVNEQFDEADREVLGKHNIKGNMLEECPGWLRKWASLIMQFVQFECKTYKQEELKKLAKLTFKDFEGLTQEEVEGKNELYAEIKKMDLFNTRFQNLVTSLDKLKYYLGSIKDKASPISLQSPEVVLKALWNINRAPKKAPKDCDSVVFSLVTHFQKHNLNRQLAVVEQVSKYIREEQNINKKLYFARLGFLILSHLLKLNNGKHEQLSDILYFYAFTHTYFTTHDYKCLDSLRMVVHFKDFLTAPSKLQNQEESCKRQYSSQFVWGQLVAWFKQTIASPQSSLSQDRRGTLSYPTIDSITRLNSYPFEGHCRSKFFQVLKDKPFSSWPPEGCPWSYKNNSKSYGTFLFESIYNTHKLKDIQMPGMQHVSGVRMDKRLIAYVLGTIDKSIDAKFQLFAQVQQLLEGTNREEVLNHKDLFWGEGFEESKRSLPPLEMEQAGRIIMKKQKVD